MSIPDADLFSFEEAEKIFSVDDLSRMIKQMLEGNPHFRDIRVRGEVSNFHHQYSSGHMYFTLKSPRSQIKCASFRGMNRRFSFIPKNGMKLIVTGSVNVYEARGNYQIIVKDVRHDGMGDLHAEFERLKAKLKNEGLFEDEHKQPIPLFPKRIGVSSGAGSAALHDIFKVIGRRYPAAGLVVVPTIVQGVNAEASIIRALRMLNSLGNLDLIILARGGGSLEDLWAFNLESVAREVFASKTPVITGIGHQTDFTLCDFVSDMRAPTPSVAAEMAVPDSSELFSRVRDLKRSAVNLVARKIEGAAIKFGMYDDHILMKDPGRLLFRYLENHGDMHERLIRTSDISRERRAERLRYMNESILYRKPLANVERKRASLMQLVFEMNLYFGHRHQNVCERLKIYTAAVFRSSPADRLKRMDGDVKKHAKRLVAEVRTAQRYRGKSVEKYSMLVSSLSPLNVMDRGYALVLNTEGRLISDASQVSVGDDLKIRLRSSALRARVKDKEAEIDDGIINA